MLSSMHDVLYAMHMLGGRGVPSSHDLISLRYKHITLDFSVSLILQFIGDNSISK